VSAIFSAYALRTAFFPFRRPALLFGLLIGLWLCAGAQAAASSASTGDAHPPPAAQEGQRLPERLSPEIAQGVEMMAGAMIMMGFRGTELAPGDPFLKAVRSGRVGHVILFDRDLATQGERNIRSAEQVRALTRSLREAAPGPFLIAVDQEGGKINRLKAEAGVVSLPSAKTLGRGTPQNTRLLASRLGRDLAGLGVSVDLAPDVDVDSNPANPAIGRLERSFSADPDQVSKHGLAFAHGLMHAGVIPTLKHFPGHGGAESDPHLELPDITARWKSEVDLKPFVDAARSGWPGMIMIGHLQHKGLDPMYPATLSPLIVNGLLRTTLDWKGVVITDDMQMRAITDRFSLEQSIALAVNAGCDILLFGNNAHWDPDLPAKAHAALVGLVRQGVIPRERIRQSWQRITKLYASLASAGLELVNDPGPPLVRIQ
jgi:beta-N-acetylhexosaminidase